MNTVKACIVFIIMPVTISVVASTYATETNWPQRILITNDDGINDQNMLALAVSLAEIAEVVIVAPKEDQSGTTHDVSVFRDYRLLVEHLSFEKGIRAYAVDGTPGDCILLALKGLFRDTPPDLIISGINGGPNLGFDWLFSGTIGAARLAAVWGIPSIAVSGIDGSSPDMRERVNNWLVDFASSSFIRSLDKGRYVTVSIPNVKPFDIKGIQIVPRAGILSEFSFTRQKSTSTEKTTELWFIERPHPVPPDNSYNDANLYYEGYIIITPMWSDEHDFDLMSDWNQRISELPDW